MVSGAAAAPAVYFTEDMALGRQKFIDTAAAADAAHNAANSSTTQNSQIFEIDLLRTTGYRFSITDPLTSSNIYVQTTRAGAPALNQQNGDLGGDGFTNWSVNYSRGDWSSVVAAGYTVSFFSDAGYSSPYMMNALAMNVSDWGTCCASQNTRPDGSTVDASEIYMLFNGSTPLLVGGISSTIGGTEHFVAAIDDRNAFSSVTLAPNGSGEFFGAGGRLIFSTLALNSVPAGSSLVTVGTPPPPPTIGSGASYTADQLQAGTVNPTFDGGTLLFTTQTEVTKDLQIGAAGGTIDTMAGDATISGDLSDDSGPSGALIKAGSGTLILTGDNSYSGGTTVLDGTLRGHSGSLQGDIVNSGTVDFAQAADGTYTGTMSGTGDLVKTGGGTLTLTNTHNFDGDTVIQEGTLALGGSGSIAGSSRVVADGTFDIAATDDGAAVRSLGGNGTVALGDKTLTVTQGDDTFGGGIGGTGGLNLTGGTLTLTGSNGFTGDTVVATGAGLALAGSGNIAGSSRVTTDGTFDISGTDDGAAIRSLGGTGRVALGDNTLTVTQGADTFGGGIGGTGGLNLTGGTLTLAGANGFTGDTVIDPTATLALAGAGSLDGTGRVSSNGTFDIAGTDDGAAIRSLGGTGTVALGDKKLTVTEGADTFGGGIGGTGGLNLTGGTLTLTGSNGFTGDTVIDPTATLALAGAGSLEGAGRVSSNGTFDIAGTDDGAAIRSLGGNGTVALGDKTLTVTQGADTFGGGIDGTGGLNLTGGILTLTGSNGFTGDTVINPTATLALVGAGSLDGTGRVSSSGTFDIAGTDDGAAIKSLGGNGIVALGDKTLTVTQGADTFGGGIGGAGGVEVSGGTLALTGVNSFTGGLAIGSATVQVGRDASLGDGPVTIGAGRLQATDGFGTNKAMTVTSGNSTIDTGMFDLAVAGPVSGPGTLNKTGAGRLTLSGTNSQNGLDIREGSVLLQSGASAGAADGDIVLHRDTSFIAGGDMTLLQNLRVEGGNALFDTGANSVVLTGVSTGSDCLIKTGSGQLTLAAAASNAIGACVRQGTLTFNNVFDGKVWVEEGGTAGGSGIINGDMDVRGVLAPGNSPGRLVVQGSVTQASSSTLALDIDGTTAGNGAGHFDTLVLTGANSIYTAGGTIAPRLRGITGAATNSYTPDVGVTYDVVTAQGGVQGAFTALTQPTQGLAPGSRFEVLYLPNAVRLAVAADSYGQLMGAAGSANAAAVGYAVDATRRETFIRGNSNADLFGQGLLGRNTAQLSRTLQQASGEIHAIGMDTVVQASRNSRTLVTEHLASQPDVLPAGRLWGSAWIESADVDGDRHGPAYRADLESYLVGLDGQVAQGLIMGGAVGYSRARAETDFVGTGDTDSFQLMAYGSWTNTATYLSGVVSVSLDRHEIERQVELTSGTPQLFSRPQGSSVGADLELGHRFDLGGVRLTPLVGVAYDGIGRDAFTERGEAIAALSFDDDRRDAVVGRVGARLSLPAGAVTPSASAMVSHELADLSTRLTPELNGTRFTTIAPEIGRTALRLGAGVNATVANNVAVRVGYRFVGLNNADAHAAHAAVSIAF